MSLRFFRHITVVFLLSLLSLPCWSLSCSDIFQEPVSRAQATDPVVQLQLWEQFFNTEQFRKPADAVQIEFKNLSPREVIVNETGHSPLALKDVLISPQGDVRWFLHPLNTAPSVPYYKEGTNGSILGYYSASRSMFVNIQGMLFSFKLATNRPHPHSALQPSKADLHNDVILSLRRSNHVREVESRIGPSETLVVLKEVVSVAARNGGNGFSVRDLRVLQDGNYYLPAFAIPYFGREIARFHNTDFVKFWEQAYAIKLGEAKAQFLLRYGLQMSTPNAQNWLIQLDKNMRPTGKIFVRDIADSSLVHFVATELGFSESVRRDSADDYRLALKIHPNREDSFWQMELSPSMNENIIRIWYEAHDRAYLDTIHRELGLTANTYDIPGLFQYFHTEAGRSALERYAKRIGLID